MNNFQAKALKEASHYLEDKLNLFKKGGANTNKKNVYKLEDKKETGFKKLVGSIFSK
jgi:23S rRNA maturation mini-RNase III